MSQILKLPYIYQAEVVLEGKRKSETVYIQSETDIEIAEVGVEDVNHVGSMIKRDVNPSKGETKYYTVNGMDGLFQTPDYKPYSTAKTWDTLQKKLMEIVESRHAHQNALHNTTETRVFPVYVTRVYNDLGAILNRNLDVQEYENFSKKVTYMGDDNTYRYFKEGDVQIKKQISDNSDSTLQKIHKSLNQQLISMNGLPLTGTYGPFVNKHKAIFNNDFSRIYNMGREVDLNNVNYACNQVNNPVFGNIFPVILGEASMMKNGYGMYDYDFKAFSSEAFLTEGVRNFIDNYPIFTLGYLKPDSGVSGNDMTNMFFSKSSEEMEAIMQYVKARNLMVENKLPDYTANCIDKINTLLSITKDESLIDNLKSNLEKYEFFQNNVLPVYEKLLDNDVEMSLTQENTIYAPSGMLLN